MGRRHPHKPRRRGGRASPAAAAAASIMTVFWLRASGSHGRMHPCLIMPKKASPGTSALGFHRLASSSDTEDCQRPAVPSPRPVRPRQHSPRSACVPTPAVLRRLAWARYPSTALVSRLRTANAGRRPREDVIAARHIEIACDESGFSGGNLVGGQNQVFAHASVRMEPGDARKLVDSLLQQIGAHGSGEYKAAELLRSRHRPVLKRLLGPSSPIPGNVRPPHRHPLLRARPRA